MPPHATQPSCPRCGYDQSGEVATWTDRCPVSGTCPECGTVYQWADLFDPGRQDVRWLVEHAESLGGRLRRTLPTLIRMALPWVFWRRVSVRHRTHPGSIVRWLVLLALLSHLITWVPFSIFFGMLDRGIWLSIAGVREFFQDSSGRDLLDAGLTGLVWPLGFFSNLSFFWDDFYGGRTLLAFFRVPLGIGLTWALVMSALPVTRRLAKLRRAHVLRAMLFQWAGVVLGFFAIRLVIPIGELTANPAVGFAAVGLFLLVCVWCLVWWVAALRVGWGVRSWPLAALGTVAALIGGIVAASIEASMSYTWFLLGG